MRLEADLWLDGNRTFLMSRQQRGPGLVAAALLKHFNDRHRQRLLPQSAGELVARRLTTATRLGADPAVLVHAGVALRSEEHTSELQSHSDLVCRLLLEKKKKLELNTPTLCIIQSAIHKYI